MKADHAASISGRSAAGTDVADDDPLLMPVLDLRSLQARVIDLEGVPALVLDDGDVRVLLARGLTGRVEPALEGVQRLGGGLRRLTEALGGGQLQAIPDTHVDEIRAAVRLLRALSRGDGTLADWLSAVAERESRFVAANLGETADPQEGDEAFGALTVARAVNGTEHDS